MKKLLSLSIGALLAGCSSSASTDLGPPSFHIVITAVDGHAPPDLTKDPPDAPLPANLGDRFEDWSFTIEARSPEGELVPFDGMVRLSTRPGAIDHLEGEGAIGRNIQIKGGKAQGVAKVTAVYGPSRIWVEDLGYIPAAPGKKPACSDGIDNDGDVVIDFPADPGCAFADDDSEEGGSYAAAVSGPVAYALPTLSDAQGRGTATPYPFEALELNADAPAHLVVTRVASDGFYVTDINPKEMDPVTGGYNHMFAFNFSTPAGMRVCDRVTYLSGTINEFFGFTELNFPSYQLSYPVGGKDECEVPEPFVLDQKALADPLVMEKHESGLVRIEGFHVAKHFGPKPAPKNVFTEGSSCDLNGDGQVDFASQDEGSCATACDADIECSEFTAFSARGNYRISNGKVSIQIQTGTVSTFDPTGNLGTVLDAVTGTLRNFSGGSQNWTIETRCPDDLVCGTAGCSKMVKDSKTACVRLRTVDDNDQGTN
ncbi:MAG: hypothetical protein U0359_42140 [Byssovorax sp.]